MAPVSPMDLAPPWALRHPARVLEVVGQQAAEDERPAVALGVGHMPGRIDEGGEAIVADHVRVDPERVEPDTMHRALAVARITLREVRAHHELAALERNQ